MIDQEVQDFVKSKIEQHKHKNIDSPRVDYNDLLNQPATVTVPPAVSAVAAKMYLTGAQTIANGSNQRVAFDTVSFQTTGVSADSSNARFVVTDAGYYHIHAQMLYGAVTDTMTMNGMIVKNNITANPLSKSAYVAYKTDIQGVYVDDILSLAASDFIELYIFHNHASAPNRDLQAGEIYTFASIHKL